MSKKIRIVYFVLIALFISSIGSVSYSVNAESNGSSTGSGDIGDNSGNPDTVNQSYSWSNVSSLKKLSIGFTLSTAKSVTFSFNKCTAGAAIVHVYKFYVGTPVKTFYIPGTYIPTQYVSESLSAGNYYFAVVPQSGPGNSPTSGSIYVTGVDGVINVND